MDITNKSGKKTISQISDIKSAWVQFVLRFIVLFFATSLIIMLGFIPLLILWMLANPGESIFVTPDPGELQMMLKGIFGLSLILIFIAGIWHIKDEN